jgi:hypothetical protein
MNIKGIFILCCMSLLISCSSNKAKMQITELTLCSNHICKPAASAYSSEQLANVLQQLLKANENEQASICSANSKTQECLKQKICYLVLGGLLPGKGCASFLALNNIEATPATADMNMKASMPLSFIGTKVSCAEANAKLSVKSINDATISLDSYHCSWMLMGQMQATLTFNVNSIDKDTGAISGYWYHSVVGTGNGSGSGYARLQFPNNINWDAAK